MVRLAIVTASGFMGQLPVSLGSITQQYHPAVSLGSIAKQDS